MKESTPRKYFPLLVYREVVRRWQGPAIWMMPASLALWWVLFSNPQTTAVSWFSLGIFVVSLLILLYILLARNAAVRCYSDHFTIRNPLYPIAISYQRVTMVRPMEFRTIFPLEKQKGIWVNIFRDLWSKTAVVVDLKSYPMPYWWMKLWMSPYLFNPKGNSLVLLTDEWMALSRQLDSARVQYAEELRKRRAAHTSY